MTEYDYSPEAYERYLATQNRIANWVNQTEQHRSQFEAAVPTGPRPASSQVRPMSYPPQLKLKRSSPPSSPNHPPQGPSRPPFISPPESVSSDEYSDPSAMSLPNQSMVLPQQPLYHTMMQPMVQQPQMMLPPTYITAPHRSHHHQRRSHSQSRSRSHHSQAYYSMASPPLSPGYQYGYPPVMGAPPPGYVMIPQDPRQLPIMSALTPMPHSAPASVTAFSTPPMQPTINDGGYFQPHVHHAAMAANPQPSSAFVSPSSTVYSSPSSMGVWSPYNTGSQVHSVMSMPPGNVGMMPTSSPYSINTPYYYGIPVPPQHASQYLAPPLTLPQGLHQRVSDLSGRRHNIRHSVG